VWFPAADTIAFSEGGVEALRIDSSGNVGIGTSSPAKKLDVLGEAQISFNSVDTYLYYQSTSNYTGRKTDGNMWMNVAGGQANVFGIDGVEKVRIDSSGYFRVNQPTSTGSIQTEISFPPSSTIATRYNMTDTTYNNAAIEFRTTGPARVGYIYCNGSSTSYNTTSDYRLKTNLQPMTGASDRVLALKPVNFEWISTGTCVDGFLAHEAQAVVPEAVHGTKDAMRDEEYEVTAAVLDADGTVVTAAVMGTRSVPDYQGIDQSKLVPLLTAALQEALTKIADMETRLSALEG
jgi:hypothetical protein